MIGKIKRVPLREVWKHEALDFTTWLEENIDVLNEIVDVNLSSVEREKDAGKFSIDLVAEDEAGNPVIIENQLEKSDHDHLGKVITYLTSMAAKTAIWIVSEPRPEHVNAITWLNESSSASFFLIKVEAIQIGDSPPAPLLTPIVGPSEEGRVIGGKKKEIAERHLIRERYWSVILEHAKSKTKLHSNISPSQYNWIGAGAGIRGVSFNYSVTQHETQVEIYIDQGKDADEENLSIFKQLEEHKVEIEKSFGEALDWQELENRRACRIKKTLPIGGYRDEEERWPAIAETAVDAMVRLEKAIRPFIKNIKI